MTLKITKANVPVPVHVTGLCCVFILWLFSVEQFCVSRIDDVPKVRYRILTIVYGTMEFILEAVISSHYENRTVTYFKNVFICICPYHLNFDFCVWPFIYFFEYIIIYKCVCICVICKKKKASSRSLVLGVRIQAFLVIVVGLYCSYVFTSRSIEALYRDRTVQFFFKKKKKKKKKKKRESPKWFQVLWKSLFYVHYCIYGTCYLVAFASSAHSSFPISVYNIYQNFHVTVGSSLAAVAVYQVRVQVHAAWLQGKQNLRRRKNTNEDTSQQHMHQHHLESQNHTKNVMLNSNTNSINNNNNNNNSPVHHNNNTQPRDAIVLMDVSPLSTHDTSPQTLEQSQNESKKQSTQSSQAAALVQQLFKAKTKLDIILVALFVVSLSGGIRDKLFSIAIMSYIGLISFYFFFFFFFQSSACSMYVPMNTYTY
ncbi:hypothetical protein RFI_26979 [Reticulomyxa filosa]|uniref:Uncharacterized protein n=1 Tax=Reticulomyxa filosa TaxID=46433 RepID=X6MBK2_RETFI|nr:hypothetical protein RFI_26979 [Reticulomyxa filosa]|eukprot:ETO10400.1 hypothetical protein RFI_26979 [Reticulomyxa filosa]